MQITLKAGREKSLLRRHPWIFASAIASMDGNSVAAGSTVDVLSSEGRFLARASYSPHSQIRARVWSFDEEAIDRDFFRSRIKDAIQFRRKLKTDKEGNAERLVHAESDGIPGLIVDRYDDELVLQSLTAGSEFWKETLADLLIEETGLKHIYERSDSDVRGLEGLDPLSAKLRGEPRGRVIITEYGLRFHADILHGHKTGFYLDQRANRLRAGELSTDREVLNCFCYSGGFSIHALANGARSVTSIDSSSEALNLARENIILNGMESRQAEWLDGDVFQLLRKFRDEGRTFDMVILDPPKFAPTVAHADKASRAYKDINLLAFKLLRLGGILVTFSCSGGVDPALFQKIVASAALDAGADARIVERLSQGWDHPVQLNFPEGAYLKGLICIKS